MSRKPSRKKLRRWRRAAERHGMTILEYRENPPTGKRRRAADPYEQHEQWRREAGR